MSTMPIQMRSPTSPTKKNPYIALSFQVLRFENVRAYPNFESKWPIMSSQLRHNSYTIVEEMKFCIGLWKLQLPYVNKLDTVMSPQ